MRDFQRSVPRASRRKLLISDNIGIMSRKYSLIALIVSAVLNVMAGINLAHSRWRIDLGPSLSIVTSIALVAVTWIYTQQTKQLVKSQEKQLADQQGQSHYAAASELWSHAISAIDTLGFYELRMSGPFDSNLDTEVRAERAKEIRLGGDKLRQHAKEILRLVVTVEEPLYQSTWQISNELAIAALDMTRFSTSIYLEATRAFNESGAFIVANVAEAWENPVDPKDRSEVRWAEMQSGASLKIVQDNLYKYRDECAAAVKQRKSVPIPKKAT
jgi:hypothetical protein